jgi:hypothetical protein
MTGEGKVFKGRQFIADVHYELLVHSDYRTTRTMEGKGRYLAGRTMQLQISPSTAVSKYFGSLVRATMLALFSCDRYAVH